MKFRLIPSNDQFFVLFSEAAANLAEAANALRSMVADLADAEQLGAVVRTHEEAGAELTRRLLAELDRSFVTPFDREDVHGLAEQIDDVLDDIHHLSEVLLILPFETLLPEFLDQIETIGSMTSQVVELIARMEDMTGLKPLLDEIDRLENHGDDLYRRAIGRLFSGQLEALEVIKWKDLIDGAEEAIDGIEDIADIVATISFKHA
jgi:uncharacterized protein